MFHTMSDHDRRTDRRAPCESIFFSRAMHRAGKMHI